ncbi:hypothetical protein HN592_00685 [Candidatus Woesearchaeota archaeon]|nr:hypothetical protein [Candidatus Woesearchaeota archaeon]MBT4368820.1 hypothetical protein [Candidatus Woesearchaeota archaeon]MBT4712109.1 hypothetical protein [Candidatus Woesearchaeota archaeon]MBT6639143.1 hypothetical protein [Candidatus Woesearchaeota archaeon]MBT7134343.1 hypothetical protein [Candidatus Woesearchaeota archaeon]
MKYLILLLFVLALTACAPKECETSEDCIPASCCHASTCTTLTNAPSDCAFTFCSQECVPNTLDCNQGGCQCIKNRCLAVLK